jgi:DNA-binding LacI/PurR family transcriptional regulator
MVTQVEIAKHVGIDVSSVNKIINKSPGKFKKETIAAVFKAAKKFKYNFRRSSKANLRRILMQLFPKDSAPVEIALARGVTVPTAVEILLTLYGT